MSSADDAPEYKRQASGYGSLDSQEIAEYVAFKDLLLPRLISVKCTLQQFETDFRDPVTVARTFSITAPSPADETVHSKYFKSL